MEPIEWLVVAAVAGVSFLFGRNTRKTSGDDVEKKPRRGAQGKSVTDDDE
jgi:hypothetical protein